MKHKISNLKVHRIKFNNLPYPGGLSFKNPLPSHAVWFTANINQDRLMSRTYAVIPTDLKGALEEFFEDIDENYIPTT